LRDADDLTSGGQIGRHDEGLSAKELTRPSLLKSGWIEEIGND
jgi:hypothetical protein